MPRPVVSLVIPIYNEEEVLPTLGARLSDLVGKLGVDWEVVFVNDGSRDRSLELLRAAAAAEERYRVISFSRNFGHQRAITAGLDAARGEAVVVMDADLQDPPEVVVEMLAKWREGYDVVYGKRRSREGETFFKLVSAKIFYRLFAAMIPIEVPLDAGDFRLMSRRVVLAMRSLRESHRFVRGLVSWAGFKQTAVEYDRAARAAGVTKYPLRKMLGFAADGIASFSVLPLRAATYIGVTVGIVSVVYGIAALVTHIVGFTVPGWTTTVVLTSFLFSVQLVMTGVLGEYVGRIYEQVKRRPLYIVGERINFKRKRRRKGAAEPAADTTEVDAKPPVLPPGMPHGMPPLPPMETAPTMIGQPPVSHPSSARIKAPPPLPSATKPPPSVKPSAKPPPVASKPPPPVASKPPPPVASKPPPAPSIPPPSSSRKPTSGPPPSSSKPTAEPTPTDPVATAPKPAKTGE